MRGRLLAVAVAAAMSAGTVAAVAAHAATAGCRVDYAVASQWPGGSAANVTVTNLGDPLNGWRLTWSYPAGQQVTQAWNAVVTQSGSAVTAANASWNAALATNASASFGFNASWTGSNPAPASFALNGVVCDGAATGSPTPTSPPASYPNPGTVTGDVGVHDPSAVKKPAGGYVLAHTGTNLTLKTSSDRIAWRNAGSVFPGGASWTLPYTGGGNVLWAPDISLHNGQYYLYYAASTFGSQHSAIFLATSPTGASGSWTNRGLIIETTASSDYNAIDPNLVVDDQGRWWLTLGSFWTGIKMIRLDPATGRRADTTLLSVAQRTGSSTAIEAPYIFRHGAYYYLWVSFDLCCQGASSTYRTMVGRSTSVTGPYVDRNGTAMTAGGATQVLAGHGSIHGPGHEALLTDTDGDILVYHWYADNGSSLLGINRIGYDSAGWPFVY
jgi:arabinan endo-1,5-alpha-L-arabinosidase